MEFQTGDKVIFISDFIHQICPHRFPSEGTIGEVVGIEYLPPFCRLRTQNGVIPIYNKTAMIISLQIQWPKGTTSGNDRHWCDPLDVKFYEFGTNIFQKSEFPLEFLYTYS